MTHCLGGDPSPTLVRALPLALSLISLSLTHTASSLVAASLDQVIPAFSITFWINQALVILMHLGGGWT